MIDSARFAVASMIREADAIPRAAEIKTSVSKITFAFADSRASAFLAQSRTVSSDAVAERTIPDRSRLCDPSTCRKVADPRSERFDRLCFGLTKLASTAPFPFLDEVQPQFRRDRERRAHLSSDIEDLECLPALNVYIKVYI